jgi:glycosyltransferase involved in cell wall biosynthesis
MIKPSLVSIIIPTYNRADLIGETLDSILSQSYQHWECIVVDDGSTDRGLEVVNSYAKIEPRIKIFERPSDRAKGANACRNYGFEKSSGAYIQFLDSDDLLSINKLKSQIELAINTDADVITCKWGRFINNDDFRIKESSLYNSYSPASNLIIAYGLEKSFLPSHIFLVKKEVFFKSGLWNEDLKINQDGELYCRVLCQSNKVVFDVNSYVKYRIVANDKTSNLSSLEKAKDLTKSWKLISKYLRKKDKDLFKSYIDFGKKYAFGLLKVNFKKEIFRNIFFYRKQLQSFLIYKFNKKKP